MAKLEVESESAWKVRVTKECERSLVWTRNTGGLHMARRTRQKAPGPVAAAPKSLQEILRERMMQGFSSLLAPDGRSSVEVRSDDWAVDAEDDSSSLSSEAIDDDDDWAIDAEDAGRWFKFELKKKQRNRSS